MDRYGQRLAESLPVPRLHLDVAGSSMDIFGTPLLRPATVAGLWRDVALVRRLRRAGSLLHLTHHHLARYGPATGWPYILTVHDLIRWFDLTRRARLISVPTLRDRIGLRLDYAAITRAVALIAVSEASKRDLITYLRVPPERITVVYEGIDHRLFRPVEGRAGDRPYVLFVGSEHPRKNLAALVRAFALVKSDLEFRELELVKVGPPGRLAEDRFRERTVAMIEELGVGADVRLVDYVLDDEPPGYYSGAQCLVLPSHYEGFGFPPLEAMACGCPVIVSSAGSLPEIVADAGVVVAPDDVAGLAAAIRSVITDTALRTRLVDRGIARAGEFTWERPAAQTMTVSEKTVQRSARAGDTDLISPGPTVD